MICLRHEAGKGWAQPLQKKAQGGLTLVRIFTRKDTYKELLITIRHVFATGVLPGDPSPVGISGSSESLDNIPGGVIAKRIEEVLNDYETTRPQTAFTDEAIAKRSSLEHRDS